MPTPSIPNPPTWTTNELISAPLLRASVSDAVAFLSHKPTFVGLQTAAAQGMLANTITAVHLDTEVYDNYGGHNLNYGSFTDFNYKNQLPGWYLVEGCVPINPASSGSGSHITAIGASQSGGSLVQYYGSSARNNTGSPVSTMAAKLVRFSGNPADFANLSALNTNAQTMRNSPQTPFLTAQWVCNLTGTEPLAVPVNAAWAVPPAIVTSTFLNTNITKTIQFLTYPPILECYKSAANPALASQSSYPTVGSLVNMDTIVIDNYGAYSGAGTWTVPVSGVYYVYVSIWLNSNAGSVTQSSGITVTSANYNGGTQITLWGGSCLAINATGAVSGTVVRKRLRLNAGDTVQAAALQDSGGNETYAGANALGGLSTSPRMIAVWMGS